MAAGLEVGGLQRAGGGNGLDRDFLTETERLRRGQAGRNDVAALPGDADIDEARDHLEGEAIAGNFPAIAFARARQHKGGADAGVAGERQLGLRRENADLRGVRGSLGGSTNVVSARLNSAAIACMRSVERPSALVTTASGLPPNCRSVKTSTVTKFNFILDLAPDDRDHAALRDVCFNASATSRSAT